MRKLLLEVVRQRFGDIPFILFTIRSRDEVIIDAINKGADNYIQKSANHEAQFADLAHKIKQAVNRKKTKLSLLDQEKYISDILDRHDKMIREEIDEEIEEIKIQIEAL